MKRFEFRKIKSKTMSLVSYYSSLIFFLMALGFIWLFFEFAMGGLPSRYNSLSYLPTNLQARYYQISHFFSSNTNTAKTNDDVNLPVLLYHGINLQNDTDKQTEGYNVSLQNFYKQMIYIKNAGYTTITTQELYDYIYNHHPLPTKPIMVTFDDGIKTSYYASRTILESLDMKAVMFDIAGDSLLHPGNYYLNENELSSMVHSGHWDIQSHAYDGHKQVVVDDTGKYGSYYGNKSWINDQNGLESDSQYEERISADLLKAAVALENMLHINATSIAYPYGDTGENSINYRNANNVLIENSEKVYKFGFVQWWPSRGYSQNLIKQGQTVFLLKRLTVGADWNAEKLASVLYSGQINKLPYSMQKSGTDNVLTLWGDVEKNNNKIILKANKDSSGAGIILDGSQYWQNYSLSASLNNNVNDSIQLILKYRDNNNYIGCNYYKKGMSIIYKSEGIETILNSQQIENGNSLKTDISGALTNNDISCNFSGINISSPFKIPSNLMTGSVGFFAYNQYIGQSYLELTDISSRSR